VTQHFEEPFANTVRPAEHAIDPLSGQPILDANAEIRLDRLTGREVVVTPGRSRRPHAGERREPPPRPRHVADCPLCPGNEQLTPSPDLTLTLPDATDPWTIRVVPNLYPIVSPSRPGRNAGRAATGVHEVVIDTPAHNQELPDFSPAHLSLLMQAYQGRLAELHARPATRFTTVFKNRGHDAGTSLEHPHSQVVALDFLPREVRHRVQIARRHQREHNGCLLCDVVAQERRAEERVVFEDEGFVALAPYASASAGEVLLVPLTHAPSFTTTPAAERDRLGACLARLLRQTRDAFDDPAYNLVLHTAPKRWRGDAALHWYWQLVPRLTRSAGLELAAGFSINPLAPEEAAAQLRDASPA
jgi:UDPglucose--hexose-1-phosphate uridylyltransferase